MRIISSLFLGLIATFSTLSHAADWELQSKTSQLNFISIKNNSIAEVHDFTTLSGSINKKGEAVLTISLPSVETSIGIRNERMKEHLFESKQYPVATFITFIDMDKAQKIAKCCPCTHLDLSHAICHKLVTSQGIRNVGSEVSSPSTVYQTSFKSGSLPIFPNYRIFR